MLLLLYKKKKTSTSFLFPDISKNKKQGEKKSEYLNFFSQTTTNTFGANKNKLASIEHNPSKESAFMIIIIIRYLYIYIYIYPYVYIYL